MKRILFIGLMLVMLAAMGFTQAGTVDAAPGVAALASGTPELGTPTAGTPTAKPAAKTKARTYTVLVGADRVKDGITLMSFFPQKLTIHVGDSVVWRANSHEIHTVSFLAGTPLPDFLIPAPPGLASPLMFNPLAAVPAAPTKGMYDGTTYANSGIMSTDKGYIKTFRLTFTAEGTFPFVCIVHGTMMSGEIDVVPATQTVLSPARMNSVGKLEASTLFKTVPTVMAQGNALAQKPIVNSDGTTTHNVVMGFSSGVVSIMRFFPTNLVVHPGDTVTWIMPSGGDEPHTVTFLNKHPKPSLVTVVAQPGSTATPGGPGTAVPQPGGPPLLLLNPAVLLPSPNVTAPGATLNRKDYFNSGILNPLPMGPDTFSIVVGDTPGKLAYICLLHDTSGMRGSLTVTKLKATKTATPAPSGTPMPTSMPTSEPTSMSTP